MPKHTDPEKSLAHHTRIEYGAGSDSFHDGVLSVRDVIAFAGRLIVRAAEP